MNKYIIIVLSPTPVDWLEECIKEACASTFVAKGVLLNGLGRAVTFAYESDLYDLQGLIGDAAKEKVKANEEIRTPIYFLFNITDPTNLAASMPAAAFNHILTSGLYSKQELKNWAKFYEKCKSKHEKINNMTMDQLLDLISERGGIEHLTVVEMNRLKFLQKKC